MIRKLARKPYRVVVKVAKKITDFEQVKDENHKLSAENQRLTDGNQKLKLENNEITTKLNFFEKDYNFGWPKGHYYSPVHSIDDLKHYNNAKNRSKKTFAESIPGYSEKRMVEVFNEIKPYFKEFDYPEDDDGKSRFYTKNVSLSLMDSLVIFSMIRKQKPRRIIEIGSGFSSGLMMEINEKYFDNNIDITFIEPYPHLLHQRMRKGDKTRYKVIPSGVQEVPIDVFKQLKKGDILFIDSTHVSKFNSDVNYEIFNILPIIPKGVIIHVHDIHDGFEYPLNWLEMGWAWNEAYLLRAFLMNNNDYEIMLANNFIKLNQPALVSEITRANKMYSSTGEEIIRHDGSLWLRKI